MVKDEMGLVSKDPEVGKRSLPLGHGVPGADVQEETSAVGALPLELLVPTRSSAQAVQTKSIGARSSLPRAAGLQGSSRRTTFSS